MRTSEGVSELLAELGRHDNNRIRDWSTGAARPIIQHMIFPHVFSRLDTSLLTTVPATTNAQEATHRSNLSKSPPGTLVTVISRHHVIDAELVKTFNAPGLGNSESSRPVNDTQRYQRAEKRRQRKNNKRARADATNDRDEENATERPPTHNAPTTNQARPNDTPTGPTPHDTNPARCTTDTSTATHNEDETNDGKDPLASQDTSNTRAAADGTTTTAAAMGASTAAMGTTAGSTSATAGGNENGTTTAAPAATRTTPGRSALPVSPVPPPPAVSLWLPATAAAAAAAAAGAPVAAAVAAAASAGAAPAPSVAQQLSSVLSRLEEQGRMLAIQSSTLAAHTSLLNHLMMSQQHAPPATAGSTNSLAGRSSGAPDKSTAATTRANTH